MMEKKYERVSLVDPIGRVFYSNGEVYREINSDKIEHVKSLFDSGLINELNERQLIPHTEIADYSDINKILILHHERIKHISLLKEWSFSMIKQSALLVIEIEKIVLNYGYTLKDGHVYNVLFEDNKPVFIDIGSIDVFVAAGAAVREFYAYFHQILELFIMDPSFARERLLSRHKLGVRYNCYYLNGISEHHSDYVLLDKKLNEYASITNREKFINLLLEEKERIDSMTLEYTTEWGAYQSNYSLDFDEMPDDNKRFLEIKNLCEETGIKSVLELGTNQGVLARILSHVDSIDKIIASDYDEVAVDALYLQLHTSKEQQERSKIHPAVYDITSEHCPNINYRTFEERSKSEMVIACALFHHLILSQNINIDVILEKIYRLTSRYAIIEFMPLGLWGGDNQDNPIPPSWYTDQWFEKHVCNLFAIKKVKNTGVNRIMYFLEKQERIEK